MSMRMDALEKLASQKNEIMKSKYKEKEITPKRSKKGKKFSTFQSKNLRKIKEKKEKKISQSPSLENKEKSHTFSLFPTNSQTNSNSPAKNKSKTIAYRQSQVTRSSLSEQTFENSDVRRNFKLKFL